MTITLDNNGVTQELSLPGTLNDLSVDQLLSFAPLALGSATLSDVVRYIYKILGIPEPVFKQIPADQIHDFIYLEKPIEKISETFLTLQKLPVIKGLYGPCDNGDNITGGEYVFMDIYYLAWHQSNDEQLLDKLISIIYRPRKWYWPLIKLFPSLNSGDSRVKFNGFTYEKRAKKIASWPLKYKMAVLLFIHGNRQLFLDKYRDAFFPKTPSKSRPKGDETFQNILMTIAETGTFGTLTDVQNEYIGNLFTFLQIKAREREELMSTHQ